MITSTATAAVDVAPVVRPLADVGERANQLTMSMKLTVAEMEAGAAIIEQGDHDHILRRRPLPHRPHRVSVTASVIADVNHHGADEEDLLRMIVPLVEETAEAVETAEAIEVATMRVETALEPVVAGEEEEALLLRALVHDREIVPDERAAAVAVVGVVTTAVADGTVIEGRARTKNHPSTKLLPVVGTVPEAMQCSKVMNKSNKQKVLHLRSKLPQLVPKGAADDDTATIITTDPRVAVQSVENEGEATGVTAMMTMMKTLSILSIVRRDEAKATGTAIDREEAKNESTPLHPMTTIGTEIETMPTIGAVTATPAALKRRSAELLLPRRRSAIGAIASRRVVTIRRDVTTAIAITETDKNKLMSLRRKENLVETKAIVTLKKIRLGLRLRRIEDTLPSQRLQRARHHLENPRKLFFGFFHS